MASLKLSDIQKRVVPITIDSPVSGFHIVIDIQLPSIKDWNESLLGIEFPVAPTKQRMKNGVKEDYQDFNDPEYLRERNNAFEMLAMRRVATAILGGGAFDELAGFSVQEACDWLLENADRTILLGVSQALNDLMSGTKGGVEAKKAAFQEPILPTDSDESLREQKVVTG